MSRKRRPKTRRKKKGVGLIIFLSLLIVCCLFVLTGLVRGTLGEQIGGLLPKAVTDKVTEKVTQSVMEKAVEKALESSGDADASAKAKEIIRNMDEEDKQKAEDHRKICRWRYHFRLSGDRGRRCQSGFHRGSGRVFTGKCLRGGQSAARGAVPEVWGVPVGNIEREIADRRVSRRSVSL